MPPLPKEITGKVSEVAVLGKLCAVICQNKNLLMLITAGIYVLALFAAFSNSVIIFSMLISISAIFLIIRNVLPLKYIVIWVLIFYLGILNTTLRLKNTDDLLNLAPVNSQITGTIISIPQGMPENKPKFFFNVNKIKIGSLEETFKNEKVLVTINSFPDNPVSFEGLKLYNSATLQGRLSVPFKAGNPSQFDYGNYLRNFNTYAVFYAKSVQILDKNLPPKAKIMQSINDYREKVLNIHSKYLTSPNLEILGGIVFGDDAISPPANIKQSFVNSGLLHILAASGMNVAFIYGFFFIIMSLFKIPYKPKIIIGMLMVVIYTLMTGLGASVIRAACMLLFVLAGKLIDRDAHSISLLSFVALLMLLYNPMWINDVGFQLSFIVTFGILIMAPAFVRMNKILDYLVSAVTIPIIAQLWVIPVQIFYFNNVSVYSVFANIMSVPILMVLSFGGFISSLLAIFSPIADFICKTFDFVLNPLLNILINISDFWGKLPHASIQTTHPAIYQIIIYYVILLCVSGLLYKEFREKYLRKLLAGIISLALLLALTTIHITNSSPEITVFDVGNADCFLIKTPANKYFMIDTGKSGYNKGKSQAEIIVLKYFKDTGIKKLEAVIVTHFDNDHSGGTADLLNNIKVGKLYVNDLNHDSLSAKKVYSAVKHTNTDMVLAENNQTVYDEKGLKLTNFITTGHKYDNDNSIITLLEYNNFTMLFTGDAGINSLHAIQNNIPHNLTVLKVPHHGAFTGLDRELVKHMSPEYSIVSTGENKFGHPSMYILSLLENSQILRTDIENSIRFKLNKDGFKILTYDIRRRKYVQK